MKSKCKIGVTPCEQLGEEGDRECPYSKGDGEEPLLPVLGRHPEESVDGRHHDDDLHATLTQLGGSSVSRLCITMTIRYYTGASKQLKSIYRCQ